MNIIKFYFIMGILPLYLIEGQEEKLAYIHQIFPFLEDMLITAKSRNYSKHYCNVNLSKLDRAISSLLKDTNLIFLADEVVFLKNFDKLTKQIKRFVRAQDASLFPGIFIDLTDAQLKEFLVEFHKTKKINTRVILLEDKQYAVFFRLIEHLLPEDESTWLDKVLF